MTEHAHRQCKVRRSWKQNLGTYRRRHRDDLSLLPHANPPPYLSAVQRRRRWSTRSVFSRRSEPLPRMSGTDTNSEIDKMMRVSFHFDGTRLHVAETATDCGGTDGRGVGPLPLLAARWGRTRASDREILASSVRTQDTLLSSAFSNKRNCPACTRCIKMRARCWS